MIYESYSHWGLFPVDDMALERATETLFLWAMNKPPIKKGRGWRACEAKMRECIKAYEARPVEPKHIDDWI